MKRFFVFSAAICGALLATSFCTAPRAVAGGGVRNNLNLIAPKGMQYGLGMFRGKTLRVTMMRSGTNYALHDQYDFNDSSVTIRDVAPGSGLTVVDGNGGALLVDEAFPNGAYEFHDGWYYAMLLAGPGCLQKTGSGGSGWDSSTMYCDKAAIERIKISTGKGNDVIALDPAITVPVVSRCGGQQTECGLSCFDPDDYTCCGDPDGCWVLTGQTCGVDAEACPPPVP
jgi:hypothetical protein